MNKPAPLSVKNEDHGEEFLQKLRSIYQTDAHLRSIEDLAESFETDLTKGLSEITAKRILEEGNSNDFTIPTRIPGKLLFSHFITPFHLMLWSIASWNIYKYIVQRHLELSKFSYLLTGISLIFILIVPGYILFSNEYRRKMMGDSFKKYIPEFARVFRDGELYSIETKNLVVGDIIEIIKGDIVPADARVIVAEDLKIDLININGQTAPQVRSEMCTNASPIHSENMVFLSCIVSEGNAKCMVTATGSNTFLGKIIALAGFTRHHMNTFDKEVLTFVNYLTLIGLFFLILFVGINNLNIRMLTKFSPFVFMQANVLEMILPYLLLLMFYTEPIINYNLGKNLCIYSNSRVPPLVGYTTVLCVNKTDILTESSMIISQIFVQNEFFNQYNLVAKYGEAYKALARAACLSLFTGEKYISNFNTTNIFKEPTYNAIYIYFEKSNLVTNMQNEYPKAAELLSDKRKLKCTIHTNTMDSNYIAIVYGDIDTLLPMCSSTIINDQTVEMTPDNKASIKKICSDIKDKGEKIIAFCDYILPRSKNNSEFEHFSTSIQWKKLRFVGMLTFEYPMCPFAEESIYKLRTAGIKIVMISDDDRDPLIALAIARKLGIVSNYNKSIIDLKKNDDETKYDDPLIFENEIQCKAGIYTGNQLLRLTDNELEHLIANVEEIGFIQLYPQQKMIIVECLQNLGHIVSYYGCGISDFMALNKSDIGISFNDEIAGPCKNIADLIINEDKLMTFTLAVKTGRQLLENFNKSLIYIIPPNISQMLPFFIHNFLGLPAHIHSWLIILLDIVVMNISLILLGEKPEYNVMNRNPMKKMIILRKALLVAYGKIGMIQVAAGLLSYQMVFVMYGFLPNSLLFKSHKWYCWTYNNFEDSYGQEWSYPERREIELTAQSALFITLVITQLGLGISMRTRYSSMFTRGFGIKDNKSILTSIFTSLVILLLVTYHSIGDVGFALRPLPWAAFIPSCVFTVAIITHEEIRKFLIKKYPRSWFRDEFQC